MKVKAYTTGEFSVGNVIVGTSEIFDDVLAIEDRSDYYTVRINPNREKIYSKKYWAVEIL